MKLQLGNNQPAQVIIELRSYRNQRQKHYHHKVSTQRNNRSHPSEFISKTVTQR